MKQQENGQPSPAPRRHQETKIELPTGEPDIEALRSATREWLVPLLVEKFLREQAILSRARPENAKFQLKDSGAGNSRNAGAAHSTDTTKSVLLANVGEREKHLPSDR